MERFWMFRDDDVGTRHLILRGPIAEESWFDDCVTPALFASELNAGTGDLVVDINSPGGDVFAAAEIYNQLMRYEGHIEVRVDALCASAATVIACAADTLLMSPVSMFMIHNPQTASFGEAKDFEHAIEVLQKIKDAIILAYETKSGLSAAKLSKLMDAETWMDAHSAMKLGFCDGLWGDSKDAFPQMLYQQKSADMKLVALISQKRGGRSVSRLKQELMHKHNLREE